MSGPRRKVHRALLRERRLSGFKAGKNLASVFPTEGGESFPTKVRRYVRETLRAQLGIKPGTGTL